MGGLPTCAAQARAEMRFPMRKGARV